MSKIMIFLKTKSNFYPERKKNPTLEKYIDFLIIFSKHYHSHMYKQHINNLSNKEPYALKCLMTDDDRLIKENLY